MNVDFLIYSVLAFFGGVSVACQGAANAALGSRIGLHAALFVSTSIVWLFCAVFYAVKGFGSLAAPGIAPSLYAGGLCGFVIITAAAIAFPKIGPAAAVALFVAGQGIAAIVIEHHALLGAARVAAAPSRLIGVALVIAGAMLLRK